MSDRRGGYAGGLSWAVLSIAAGILLPPPPAADADAATLLAYFGGHQNRIVIASAMSAIAALLLAPFIASLAGRFADQWAANLARIAGSIVVTAGLLGGVLQAGMARSAPSLGASTTLLSAFQVDRAVFFITPPLAMSLVLAAASAGLRRPKAPRWVGIAAGVVGLAALVGGTAGMVSTAQAVNTIGFAGFVLTIVWVGTASIALGRRPAGRGLTVGEPSVASI